MTTPLSPRIARRLSFFSLSIALVAAPISPPVPTAAPVALAPDSTPPRGVTEHVIVVSIDGLRPDAIDRFGASTLQRLVEEGGWSMEAQTIFPSKTLPSHTSMLTGLAPEEHGITWNTNKLDEHGHVDVATIFQIAQDAGLETGAFFSKSKFHHLERPGTLDHSQAPDRDSETWLVTRTVPDAVRYLEHRRPNLLFVHLGEPDYAGHVAGWMGRVYGWAVRRADAGLQELIEAADATFGAGGYTLIVTSDHGGHGRSHGTDDPLDMTIPWIAHGAGVQPGRIAAPVRTMDTAATALWLLGLSVPPAWVGTPVASAFTADARMAAAPAPAAAEPMLPPPL
ncbi:MAG TPA: ectonucleotide pyrophosphatase/phosphodiesterase [Longimicrobiales bacterium]|nr:ectonucleotide pyrophosphatase/phosphodiesterase [Longimicrobiales bacterium]